MTLSSRDTAGAVVVGAAAWLAAAQFIKGTPHLWQANAKSSHLRLLTLATPLVIAASVKSIEVFRNKTGQELVNYVVIGTATATILDAFAINLAPKSVYGHRDANTTGRAASWLLGGVGVFLGTAYVLAALHAK